LKVLEDDAIVSFKSLTAVSFACPTNSLRIASVAFKGTPASFIIRLPPTARYSGPHAVVVLDPMPTSFSTGRPSSQPVRQPTAVDTTAGITHLSGHKYCGGGQYMENKISGHEGCDSCSAGRFNNTTAFRRGDRSAGGWEKRKSAVLRLSEQ